MNEDNEIRSEEYICFSCGNFAENAGLVGLIQLLKNAGAPEGEAYRVGEREVLVNKEYLLEQDLAQLYINTMIDRFYQDTAYAWVLKTISELKGLLCDSDAEGKAHEKEQKELVKKCKEHAKIISDRLTSASYKTACQMLQESGISCNVQELVKQIKQEEGRELATLEQLEGELLLLAVKEALCMKSIIYTKINMFWENKSFLLPTNSKKDMRVLYDADFVQPLKSYIVRKPAKDKDFCISCRNPIDGKEKISIAFLKDMSDDLTRKRSAFWNCNVDAFVCPLCAFLYSLMPLGFRSIGADMVFINADGSAEELFSKNSRRLWEETETANMKWHRLYNNVLCRELNAVKGRLQNIQVVVRKKAEERYDLNIVGKDVLQLVQSSEIYLKSLEKWSAVKCNKEYINVYDGAISNLMNHRNQYLLIQQMLRISMENPGVVGCVGPLLAIQWQQTNQRKGGENLNSKLLYIASKEGNVLRSMVSGGSGDDADNKLRGMVYQLLNALQVGNMNHFTNILLRVYSSYNAKFPTVFMSATQSKEDFLNIGYAFLRGLKGGFYESKEENRDDN